MVQRRLGWGIVVMVWLLMAVSGRLEAQIVWTGNTSTTWSTGANWIGGAAPNANGAIADFSTTPTSLTPTLTAATTLGNITFSTSSAITIGGSKTLTMRASAANTPTGISLTGTTGTLAISAAVSLRAGDNFFINNSDSAANGMSFTGGVTTTATSNITVAGSGSTTFSTTAISGAGNLTVNGGTVTMGALANSYSGNTTINGGTLSVGSLVSGGSNSGIGSSNSSQVNLIINGGTLQYTGAAVSTTRNFTLGTSGGTLDASGSAALTLSNTTAFTLAGSNTARTLTFTGTSTAANTFALPIGDNGSGKTSVDKTGAGNWTLTAANTFTGTATVSAGVLKLNATGNGAMGDVGSVVVNSGGTLLLGAANQINGSSTAGAGSMTLGGGTFATGGFGQGSGMLGTLTLSTTSTIDLGAGTSVVHYAASNGQAWTGELVVLNWNGTIGSGGGTDQLFFGSSTTGLTSSQVNEIVFENPNGVAGNYSAEILNTGEVVAFKPIPEPGTFAAGGLLMGLAAWWERRRRQVPGRFRS